MGAQIGSQARDLAVARARIAELEDFIRKNATTLGLEEVPTDAQRPAPPAPPVAPDGVSGPGVAPDEPAPAGRGGQHSA